jgi:hypothetical protein
MEYTQDQIRELKTRFAEALLRTPDEPYNAAFAAIGDSGLALQAANLWARDPFVLSEKIRLCEEHGVKAFLPTKEDQAGALWKMANDKSVEPEDRLKAHRLYAELMGHIEKPSTQVTQVVNQGVMIVKDHGSNDDWETRAIAQQKGLILDAAAS